MFNTMTVTKAAGALIGSMLALMLVSWGASALYHVGPSGHHAEGEAPPQAYTIAVEGGEAAGGEAAAGAEQVDFAALMQAADPAKGEKVFGKCKSCHSVEGKDGTGPHLNGVVDREIASIAGFAYSSSMAAHAGTDWTPEALDHFLTSPKSFASNTKMSFAGLPKQDERINLIAYLQQQH